MTRKHDLPALIDAYIANRAKVDEWAESTQKSERYRLRALESLSLLTTPDELWSSLTKDKGLKPYAAKTAMIRAGDFLEYLMGKGVVAKMDANPIRAWMRNPPKSFRTAYKPKTVMMTFEEAKERIHTIEDDGIRQKALQLLATGMRVTESDNVDDEGCVVGKNGEAREVRMAKRYTAEKYDKHRATLWRHLKKVGLTPHMLRKICATKYAQMGCQEADLMKLMGWKTSSMATIYVQAQRQDEMAEKMEAEMSKPSKKSGRK